jgi:hypothetical protein
VACWGSNQKCLWMANFQKYPLSLNFTNFENAGKYFDFLHQNCCIGSVMTLDRGFRSGACSI